MVSKARIEEVIRDHQRFLIATHVQADGDGLGAMLALGDLLSRLGKSVELLSPEGGVPPQYAFMLAGRKLNGKVSGPENAVFIAVDSANSERLGGWVKTMSQCAASINIDHHPDNPLFAEYNWVKTDVSSTSELVYELWLDLYRPLTLEAAELIYVGMLTDTGRWQYSNTDSRTLRIAADLVDLGVRPTELFQRVYEQISPTLLKLLAAGLARAEFNERLSLAYTYLTQADIESTGADMAEAENLVDMLRATKNIDVALVLKETRGGEIKASARSRARTDVGQMARDFGGGGHKNASGWRSESSMLDVIEQVKSWLEEHQSSLPLT